MDVKAGRQTTVLGPMGALPWQRYFDSSDYAWYNMEEGRFTGVSAVWHINKRLDWYNGFEEGWGSFFDDVTTGVDYITQLTYWLDEEAKKTKVWTTVLTGPTSRSSGANTTVLELGLQHNWNETCVYQIVDTQMVWSKGPVGRRSPSRLQRKRLRRLHLHRRPPRQVLGHQQPIRVVRRRGRPGLCGRLRQRPSTRITMR